MEIGLYSTSGGGRPADFLPVSNVSQHSLDFTSNCTSTVAYWLDQSYPFGPDPPPGFVSPCEAADNCQGSWYRDVYWAVISALPPSLYANDSALRFFNLRTRGSLSYWTAYYGEAANYTSVINITYDSETFVTGAIDSIIYQCLPEQCRQMGFSGNADIAGVGAMVAYTVITVAAYVLTWSGPRSVADDSIKSSRLRNATVRASLAFFDTVVYFDLTTTVAGIWYTYRAQTAYEKSLSMIVAQLVNAACICCTVLYNYQPDDVGLRAVMQFLCFFAILESSGFTSSAVQDRGLIDSFCFGQAHLAAELLFLSWQLQSSVMYFLIGSVGLAAAFGFCLALKRRQSFRDVFRGLDERHARKLFVAAFGLVLASMWLNLAFIFRIREDAKDWFGPTYADNAMGYGQVMAMGSFLQTVAQWLYLLFVFKKPATRVSTLPRNTRPPLELLPLPPPYWPRPASARAASSATGFPAADGGARNPAGGADSAARPTLRRTATAAAENAHR